MIKVKEYRGHIRNWEALCQELGIDTEQGYKERDVIVQPNCEEQGVMAASICEAQNGGGALTREEREEAILIKAYEKWGCDMADHMHGMFAFAL